MLSSFEREKSFKTWGPDVAVRTACTKNTTTVELQWLEH